MSWNFGLLATLRTLQGHGSWRNTGSCLTPCWIGHRDYEWLISMAVHQSQGHPTRFQACLLGGYAQPQVYACIPKGVAHNFSCQKVCINNLHSASENSLSWALGLAGPFSRSDFLLRYCLSILRNPDYWRSDFQFIVLLMELKSGNPTQLESRILFR